MFKLPEVERKTLHEMSKIYMVGGVMGMVVGEKATSAFLFSLGAIGYYLTRYKAKPETLEKYKKTNTPF